MTLTPFHLAIQVRDIDEAREFYGVKMGLPEGRSSQQWIDFDLFGHQLVTHLNPSIGKQDQLIALPTMLMATVYRYLISGLCSP